MALVDMNRAFGFDDGQPLHAFFAIYDGEYCPNPALWLLSIRACLTPALPCGAGHNGDSTSDLLGRRLHHNIVASDSFFKDLPAAVTEACLRTDEECQDMNVKDEHYSGSTAVMLFVKQLAKGHMVCSLHARRVLSLLTINHTTRSYTCFGITVVLLHSSCTAPTLATAVRC